MRRCWLPARHGETSATNSVFLARLLLPLSVCRCVSVCVQSLTSGQRSMMKLYSVLRSTANFAT